ncbi:glycosyltransferase family 4 protein [Aquabacterium sp. NJ1]|uniref:glycosyltransferase family 4 protein n=1 Tax=Aquabacterium sp. NJ1 TaxID=1538295 RepID=UPI0009DF75D8|nr:glycosyltransferase family 4 protein [Aquabacterium sp. NJ1]
MKIAYINSFYAPHEVGGAEKSVRFLAETLVKHGHQATVICLGRERETTELNGVRIERLPTANLYFPPDAGQRPGWQKMIWHGADSYNPLAARDIGRLLDEIRPDVVHTNNLGGFSVAAWSAIHERNISVVHTLRDYYLMCPNTAMFKNGLPCKSRCMSCSIMAAPRLATSRHIKHVIGNSQYILNKHVEAGYFRNAHRDVIYNAYQPSQVEDHRTRDRITFGFLGRIAPSKGIEILIDAVRQIESPYPFEVLIAGDGEPEYVAQLKSKAEGLPISFTGRVQPHELYDRVNWTIVPSVWDEPLARVLFESYAHGVPVIGSSAGGTPEVLTNGKTGLLYTAPLDPTALRAQMLKALNDPTLSERLSPACSKYAENFHPRNVYLRYEQVYLSSVNTK